MKTFPKTTLFTALIAAAALPAGATVIVGAPTPNADAIQIPTMNYNGPGPISFSNYTWTSNNADYSGGSVFGYTGFYGFNDNGFWDGALGPMAGLNSPFTNTMKFTFDDPVYEVGDFFNYSPGTSDPTTIDAYSSSGALIESYNLSFLTGGPNGADLGEWITFDESTPISYLTMTGNYIGIADPSDPPTPTPEPDSLLLLGTGVVALAGAVRRKLAKN